MRTRTLPGIESVTGWTHPYPLDSWSPFFYADGGDGTRDGGSADEDDQDADGGESDKDDADDSTDWKSEAEKWKAQARKHEARAKENAGAAKERDRLRLEGLPEQERKVDEAVAKALAEERAKSGTKLARQAFLAAAKGVIENAGDVADDVNLGRYVNDDGEVDEEGLAELVKRLAPKSSTSEASESDGGEGRDTRRGDRGFDQGARGGRSKSRRAASVAAGRDLWAERHGNKST
ncbi:hypothetical protein AB0J38_12120 [Streptomyces sp. NPDC050095]|uniref:hypothetical protein n=1 Tax=unclassified Streptomyces TaxID=2593676 RepID=UPI0034404057